MLLKDRCRKLLYIQLGITLTKMNTLEIYPINDSESIGSIFLNDVSEQEVHMIIILDKSKSMKSESTRMVTEIFPDFLSKLSYKPKDVVTLITFESVGERHNLKIEGLKKFPAEAAGGTNMAPAILKLREKLFEFSDPRVPIRLLTVSDGEISDPYETKKATQGLIRQLAKQHFTINSQAVRLFTSAAQPDTTALSSLIQLNNVTKPQLADISSTEGNEEIATKIAKLFMDDKLSSSCQLTFDNDIVKKYPWDQKSFKNINLVPGNNLFWIEGNVSNVTAKIGDKIASVLQQSPLTLETFNDLLKPALGNICKLMKIQKVIGSKEAKATVKKVQNYFKATEKLLGKRSPACDLPLYEKVSAALEKIVEDKTVDDMDPQQRAEYLEQPLDIKAIFNLEEFKLKLFRCGEEEEMIGTLNLLVAESSKDGCSNIVVYAQCTPISSRAHEYLEESFKSFLSGMPKVEI